MACIIKSVSITNDEDSFLREFNLSPSQLIKEKIWEMKGMLKNLAGSRMDEMKRAIGFLNQENERLRGMLKDDGVLEQD